jgi:hypothetical protein
VDITSPDGKTVSFAQGKDALVGISVTEPVLDVSAPLVFVGYGLENARYGFDDYKGLDVKGKIVVVMAGFPAGLPSEEAAHIGTTKGETAARHGAIGVISLATNASLKVRPWERSLQYAGSARFNWVESTGPNAGKAHDGADGLRASASLDDAAAKALLAGAPQSLEKIRALADKPWVAGKPVALKGFALNTSARVRGTFTSTRVTSPNVAAMIPGSDPALRDQYVVLRATSTIWAWTNPSPANPRTRIVSTTARWTMRQAPRPCWKSRVMEQDVKAGHGPAAA